MDDKELNIIKLQAEIFREHRKLSMLRKHIEDKLIILTKLENERLPKDILQRNGTERPPVLNPDKQ